MSAFRFWTITALTTPLVPLLAVQGIRTRQVTPRLPEAPGDPHGRFDGEGAALRLIAIGDSVVAGVGVPDQSESLTAHVARSLHTQTKRTVAWEAVGRNGAKAADGTHDLLPLVTTDPAVDVVMVSFGVNNTTALHTPGRFRRDMAALIDAIDGRLSSRVIVLAGMPPLGDFPALPQPLRRVLGFRAHALDAASANLAAERSHVVHVPFTADIPITPETFASDGYHPGPKACAYWGDLLAQAVLGALV